MSKKLGLEIGVKDLFQSLNLVIVYDHIKTPLEDTGIQIMKIAGLLKHTTYRLGYSGALICLVS